MNRILAALRAAPPTGKHTVTEELTRDLLWFVDYARSTNGLVLLRPPPKTYWVIECDSSLLGGGAHSESGYFTEEYPTDYIADGHHINCLEAINLVVALHALSPPNPQDFIIRINTDNKVSQSVLSTGAGRDPVLCACAREIWRYAAVNSTSIDVVHKPGKDLILADALSRAPFDPAAKARADHLCAQLQLQRIRVRHSTNRINITT